MTTKPSMGKRERHGWVESDLTSPYWRRCLSIMLNHSGPAKIKRKYRRWERRRAKRNLRKDY